MSKAKDLASLLTDSGDVKAEHLSEAIPTGATLPDPASSAGSLFYNTGDDTLHISDGAAWSLVGGAAAVAVPLATGGTVAITGISEGALGYYDVDNNFTFPSAAPFLAYSIASGTLPTGTTLNLTTGVITGTVTQDGFYSFSVLATTDGGGTTEQAYSWTISNVVPTATGGTVTITDGADGGGAVSYDVDANFTFATGSSFSAFSLQSGALPSGTTLNTSTGVISGTVSNTTVTYTFTIRATDIDGDVVDQSYSWGITYTLLPGEVVYTTAGTYSWVVPANVTSVFGVVIGGGANGTAGGGGSKGGGGGLAWKNSITVVPGDSHTIVVGSGAPSGAISQIGGDSYFISSATLKAQGGPNTGSATANVGTGTGAGGQAGQGGGGAGGYTGAGGAGGGGEAAGASGAGGGGGGGGGRAATYSYRSGGGGGTGLFGAGANGAGGAAGFSGGGGSGGADGLVQANSYGGYGGLYGGGGGAGMDGSDPAMSGKGADGGVRLMWGGSSRSFPSNAA